MQSSTTDCFTECANVYQGNKVLILFDAKISISCFSVEILKWLISSSGISPPFTKRHFWHVIHRQIYLECGCQPVSQKSLVACSTFHLRGCLSPPTVSVLMFLNVLETIIAKLFSFIRIKLSLCRPWRAIPLISSHVCLWKETNQFISILIFCFVASSLHFERALIEASYNKILFQYKTFCSGWK